MHNHYFFLKWLVPAIREKYIGAEIREVYSQQKDVLTVRSWRSGDLYLKAFLTATLSCITFPSQVSRSRRNNIDLFSHLVGRKVQDVVLPGYDRSFYFLLEDGSRFVFKMHGHRSNAILIRDGEPNQLFRNSLKGDQQFDPANIPREIPGIEAFVRSDWNFRELFPVLGNELTGRIRGPEWDQMDDASRWKKFQELVSAWSGLDKVYLDTRGDSVRLEMEEISGAEVITDPFEALGKFSRHSLRKRKLLQQRQRISSQLNQKLSRAQAYVVKAGKQLHRIRHETSYSDQADLIMAHLHLFDKGQVQIELPRFDGSGIEMIKIKEGFTPLQHAEWLYKKGKNKKIEEQMLASNIRKRELEISNWRSLQEEVRICDDPKLLERIYEDLVQEKQKGKESDYIEAIFDDFKIRVGRNAKNNDRLTFQNGYKEDLWLHVKDASGSHVLLKYRSDRKFSKIAIEKAAQLAAWYSRRKTEGMVPVIFTPRKFVRKRKGDPPGAVVVEKEQVLLVEPENWIS